MKKTDWIETYTGKHFYPIEPDIEMIDIEDISHALSNKCRFNGHCKKFYSVAQHSCLISVICRDDPLGGLLHDAAEAYLPDIPRPIKPYINGFAEIEEKLLSIIFHKYKVKWPISNNIKMIDYAMATAEGKQFGMKTDKWSNAEKESLLVFDTLGINIPEIVPWKPDTAKRMFLSFFEVFHALRRIT